jgi:murein tripeptide amidase MpaA
VPLAFLLLAAAADGRENSSTVGDDATRPTPAGRWNAAVYPTHPGESIPAGPASGKSIEIPGYHSYDALTSALREAVSAHPNLARMTSTGTSLEGREIWVVELGSDTGMPRSERPALFLGANFEGDQLAGSELSLQVIRYLLDNYDGDADVKQRLDNYTFYVFPRVNPDGAERMFRAVQEGRSTNGRAHDDDNDGRTDEDGPDDLDGDGFITLMRVPEPGAPYMIDPDDERALKRADAGKGETGGYQVYWEGVDDDGDGFYNEDPAGGVDINRNFQHEYPYYEREAGIHMVSERESRAVMDFLIAHRNIALVLVYGEHDNLVTAPNTRGELADARNVDLFGFADAGFDDASRVGMYSSGQTSGGGFGGGGFGGGGFGGGAPSGSGGQSGGGRRPATTVNTDDLEYFTAVSRKYKEITGIETAPGFDDPAGAFFEYGYYQYGVPSFSSPGWGLPAAEADTSADERGRPGGGARNGGGSGEGAGRETSFDRDLLKWMDAASVEGFIPWTPYDHPTLGRVEIGGFKPYETDNPPYEMIEELGAKQASFVVYLSSLFPRIRVAETEVTDHGGGVFRIKAEIENAGFIPSSTAHGITSRSVRPTMVQLGIAPEDLLSGDPKTSFFQALDGSGRRESFEWIVNGRRGESVELKVMSQKGGGETVRIRLE